MRYVIADTGPIVAAIRPNDAEHDICASILQSFQGSLIIPDVAITEICYLLRTQENPQTEVRFLNSVASKEFVIEHLIDDDWRRVYTLTDKYDDFPLGVVDAAVIAVAERLKISEIATLNDRHFRAVRSKHLKAFRLLPYDL